MTATVPQVLRSDAQENRDRILDAARELFAGSGLDVTMRAIARHAGVGPATLYRRFPTKESLVHEAVLRQLEVCRAIVEDAAADPDPWRAFCSVIEHATVLASENQGFAETFLATSPQGIDVAGHRAELTRGLARIARRAQAAGRLRADFVLEDLLLVLVGRRLPAAPGTLPATAARRYAALLIDAFRATGTTGVLPPLTISASARG